MKKFFVTLLVALTAVAVNAQTERNTILHVSRGNLAYTEPVQQKQNAASTVGNILGAVLQAAAGSSTTKRDCPEYADAVKDAICGAIATSRRLRLVDAQQEETDENSSNYVVDANISAITATSQLKTWTDSQNKSHSSTEYRANITGTINIKNATTGNIIFTHTINSSSWADSWFQDQTKALGYAISTMKNNIRLNLNNCFPLYASIVEGARATKSKEKEVYIDLGEYMGCCKDMHFNVYSVHMVAGKEAKKQIGQLKVTEVMGDDISLCKVQRGGADIKKAIEAGETLLITSKD